MQTATGQLNYHLMIAHLETAARRFGLGKVNLALKSIVRAGELERFVSETIRSAQAPADAPSPDTRRVTYHGSPDVAVQDIAAWTMRGLIAHRHGRTADACAYVRLACARLAYDRLCGQKAVG